MNKSDASGSILIKLALSILIFFSISANAYSISTPEEFLSHSRKAGSCTSQECHPDFSIKAGNFLHNPVASGNCSACHSAKEYPNRYGLEQDQRASCARCHNNLENEIDKRKFIHGPIKNNECTSCHDPHQSVWPFFLRKSYTELCITCHKVERLYTGEFIHKPVKDGNCGLCHDPHASDFKYRLLDAGVNLCAACHQDLVTGMSQKYIHDPIIKSGCSACHKPHAGGNRLRLKVSAKQSCYICHEEKRDEVSQYKHKHKPAAEGNCIACHSPHYSDRPNLLIDKTDAICYKCHEKNNVWEKRRFQHGPVVQGNCTACHNPHGSDNAFILRLPFPHKFYTEYEKGKYGLCFLCHKESLVTVEKTKTITNFRNGETNLHRLHVNQKKGRTCRACHDVHASNQEGRIRDEFLFGKVSIQLEYSKTQTGGSCIPGCHIERSYDRVKRVKYQHK
jgi:predicted CXXCH cytochrome family protein